MPIGFWAVARSEVHNSIQARTGIVPTEAETDRAIKIMRDSLDETFEMVIDDYKKYIFHPIMRAY